MLPALAFGTPRKLPRASSLEGRVVVLDIAFAGMVGGGFEQVTRKLIEGLGDRLAAWVDHHDHERHPEFAGDPRFYLATKAEHGACPEMITPEIVARTGPVDTVLCHTDFDGLASAAKWILGGYEPYPGCDADARAIDTRLGQPSPVAERMDRALRGRPNDAGLFGVIVRHLVGKLADPGLWRVIDAAAAELIPVERETRRAAAAYQRLARAGGRGVALVDVSQGYGKVDKTLLLLLGQEREEISMVVDRENVAVAARFDSGIDFLALFNLDGGMPTRVSLPRRRLAEMLAALGVDSSDVALR